MVFTVDIGNSNIVAGVVCGKGVRFVERLSTDREKTDIEYSVLFKTILELHDVSFDGIKGAIISSVVPELTNIIADGIEKLLDKKPLIVGPGVKTGLNIKIDDPAQLGADLVVAAVASIAEYPLPQIIFDLGTATTISYVDAQGAYQGVVITAGVRTASDSIVSKASQLSKISLEAPAHVIGKNTADSLKSGAVYGTAAMMDGMIDRINSETNSDAVVIATGGIAAEIIGSCKHDIIYDDELLLKGLYIIYNKN